MPFNLSDYMGPFLDEADEQLAALSQGLLNLEADPRDEETVQSIFRAAHSLKGAAGSMGFVAVSTLAHRMESILEEVRSGHAAADRAMIDILLRGVDLLKTLVGEISSTSNTNSDSTELCEELELFLERLAPPPPEGGAEARRLTVVLDADQPMKEVKAFLILQNLSALGRIEACHPERAALERGAFGDRFEVVVVGEAPEERLRAACNLGGVREVRVGRRDAAPEAPGGAALPPELEALGLSRAVQEAVKRELARAEVFLVSVSIRSDSALPEARNYLVYSNLVRVGRVLWSDPEGSRLEEGYAGGEVKALVVGAEKDALRRACEVAEVERAEVRAFRSPARPAPALQEAPALPVEPPAEAPPPGPARRGKIPSLRHDTIRVDIRKLDVLMNLVGELVTERARFSQLGTDFRLFLRNLRSRREAGAQATTGRLAPLQSSLLEALEHLSRLTAALQESVMDVRMVPIGNVFSRFPRMVRDLARELGKEIRLEIAGEETELDRAVVEEIGDPLVHLIRNAIDHGVEEPAERAAAGKPREAVLELRAFQQGNRIMIEVRDDGHGIDRQAVYRKAVEKGLWPENAPPPTTAAELFNLIFLPGFSTADRITDISGRGVGLDVVRRNVERLSGAVDVESQAGAGATFRIRLPLTLAIASALLVRAGETIYALPLAAVEEIHRLPVAHIQRVRNHELVQLRDGAVPVHVLPGGQPLRQADPGSEVFVAVVRVSRQRVGVAVDRLLGQADVVIKPLGRYLARVPGLAGISVLGDGSVALVLDVVALLSQRRPFTADSHPVPRSETA